MAGFNAATQIEPFDYSFRPYADTEGVVPEPSDTQVREFYIGIGNLLVDVVGEDKIRELLTDEEYVDFTQRKAEPMLKVQAATNNLENMAKAQERMVELHAAVCSGHPSRETLEALPYRVKQAFYGALQGWLSPEASRPAGK